LACTTVAISDTPRIVPQGAKRRRGARVITEADVEIAPQLEGVAPSALEVTTAGVRPSVEHAVLMNMAKALAVSVPLAVTLLVGIVALAVHTQDPNWTAYLCMAAANGVLAGSFFGLLAGFMRSSYLFDA
jgi:hypothetical protein